MVEVLVCGVMNVLTEKLSDALMNFARSEGIDMQLKDWKKKLLMIQDVLADAGQKEITQKAVKLWLHELQDLAYDIDDVLDDIATEVMKRKLNQESDDASTNTRSCKLLKTVQTCFSHFANSLTYGRTMSCKLDEITSKMNDLFKQKNDLGLVEYVKVDTSRSDKTDVRFHQTSLIDGSKVLGRDDDKATLLVKLLGDEETSKQNVSIVSIVGMGGIGKTTLAQDLYNDQKVKGHFELMAWVCVSDDFDVINISMQIYQAVGGENKEFFNLDQLQVALKKTLSNKRFLLVLDDVWNEDPQKWELLERPLVGAPGSKILLTTRNTMVASVMNSVQPHNLGVLSDEITLSLFAQYALEELDFDKHPSLKSIAQGIVKKCDGLPLALVTLGRVLKTKGIDDVEWEELLKSEIWSSQDGIDILPALKLSYYHLPSHLKQVFAYCSMFPKDYVFEKNKLILLWMAQGFLSQPKGNNQPMESLGRKYFEELLSRSFFQPVANDESLYTMHDLMNDLAISVAGEFFFLLDDKKDLNDRNNEAYEKFRHFSFIGQQRDVEYKKFKELHRARCLRTFLRLSTSRQKASDSVILELLPKLESLRVLSLSNCSITEVPQSVGSLKHLRYLNFSNTDIKRIPEQVSELYNLQSLLVRDCHQLSSLPVSFAKLINLRHLDMTNTRSLEKLPLGIGGLTGLHTLSKVIIEEDNGFKISELKGLKDLQGELSIEGLEKVIDPTQANDANLQQKKGLEDLYMEWDTHYGNPTTEYEVLERLRAPHSKLKTLSINGYGGMKFPSWLGDPSFDQLTELELRGCVNCTELAKLEHLTSLEKLQVHNCPKLVSIKGEKEVVNVGSSIMGSLRQVTLYQCDSLESYCCPNSVESLEIWNCSSMTSLSFSKLQDDLPSSSSSSNLKFLLIYNCKNIKSMGEKEVVNVGTSIMGSLRQVTLRDCHSLESYCCPNSVEKLEVHNCPKLVSIKGEKEVVNVGSSIMGSLRQVTLYQCDSLESYCCPTSVESLKISCCSSMTSLSFSKLKEDLPSSSSSSNLKFLLIYNCKNIKSMGEKEVVNVGSSIMGSLRHVTLRDCRSLESYCCPNSVERLEIVDCDSMTLSFSKLQEDLPSSSSSSSSSSNLKFLEVRDCKSIKSISQEHLQSLTSLEVMGIYKCPSMEDSFPSCGWLWPPNLRELSIGELKKPMSEWGLQNYPPSLVELKLYGKNSGVVSFGIMEEQDHNNNNTSSACFLLPPSLTNLTIRQFEEVESVSEVLQHLPHLQQLHIWSCPKLRDVPETTSSLEVFVNGKRHVI